MGSRSRQEKNEKMEEQECCNRKHMPKTYGHKPLFFHSSGSQKKEGEMDILGTAQNIHWMQNHVRALKISSGEKAVEGKQPKAFRFLSLPTG